MSTTKLETYVYFINSTLFKKGYDEPTAKGWEELEPKSMQDDAFICAAIVVYEEIKKL